VTCLKNERCASLNMCHTSGPQYKYQVRVARSTLSKILPLARFKSSTSQPRSLTEHASTLPMPRACHCLWSAPSTALPSTPLDRFALNLDCFARSTLPPPAPEHTIDLDRFADAPDRALHQRPRQRASLDSILPLPTGNPQETCEHPVWY
jgi:hypothetical protein